METGSNLMETTLPLPDKNYTQSDFITDKELNFDDVKPNDPMTKATLNDLHKNEVVEPENQVKPETNGISFDNEVKIENNVVKAKNEVQSENGFVNSEDENEKSENEILKLEVEKSKNGVAKLDNEVEKSENGVTQSEKEVMKSENENVNSENENVNSENENVNSENEAKPENEDISEKDGCMDIFGNGQLRKKILKPGKENSRPNRSDLCVLKILGKLEDGTIIDDEEEFTIQLGDMEVVQGIDLAVALMNVEEEAEIEVGPRFGYNTMGRNSPPLPNIPPNAKLIYNVTLKSSRLEPDIEELSYSEKRKIGNKKRERGNWWFSRDESTLAIHCYRKALEYLSPSNVDASENKNSNKASETITDADLQAILEDALKVHNNLAAAQLKCEAYDAALKSVENVLRCQPQNVKALFRKGKILHCKGEHDKACSVLTQALKIEPENKAIQQELMISRRKSAKDARHEKNLYRKMLGTAADKKKNDNKNKGNTKGSVLTWSLVGGTIVAVVGIIAYRFVS